MLNLFRIRQLTAAASSIVNNTTTKKIKKNSVDNIIILFLIADFILVLSWILISASV